MATKKKKKKSKSIRRGSARKNAAKGQTRKRHFKQKRAAGSARRPRRNIGPLLTALTEGIGYTAGKDAVDVVTAKRKKSKKNPRIPPRQNPTHGIATGSRKNPRLVVAGPRHKIEQLARALRSHFGRSHNIMVGKVRRKDRG